MKPTVVFEEGDRLYLVGNLAPASPAQQDIEEFAYGKSIIDDLRKRAPNEHLAWFGGHYVEADNANGNGAMWTSEELAIKSLTPMLMPVTVMHDPRTAVGMIADLALRTPEKDGVPRAKIETALALWKHRFSDVVEEAMHNYEAGTLMQSMECLAPNYDCGTCGMGFTKLAGGAEQAHWCAHLKGDDPEVTPTRILRSVVFTGTGLIFGTRGSRGADPQAHLETFQQEVAEFHQRVHKPVRPRRKRTMETIEIPRSEYDELRARPTKDELTAATDRAKQAEKDQEAAEAAKVAAESAKEEADKKVAAFEEQARQAELAKERMSKLGAGFVAALGEKTRDRVETQASSLKDEEWTARLEELEELTGKKVTDGATKTEKDETLFTPEEIAAHKGGGAGDQDPTEPSPSHRRTVLAGL